MSRHDFVHEFFGCHGATLTRLKFLLRLLNVSDQLFPAALDNATMQNLLEDFLIFQRQGLDAFQDFSKTHSL